MKDKYEELPVSRSGSNHSGSRAVLRLVASGGSLVVGSDLGLPVGFVGERPGRSEGKRPAFDSGYSAERLATLMGVTLEIFKEKYVRLNLLDQYAPGRWPRTQAKISAEALVSVVNRPVILILCGRKVFEAFDFRGQEFLTTRQRGWLTFAFIPHPSGLNHWWNDPYNVNLCEEFLRRFRR